MFATHPRSMFLTLLLATSASACVADGGAAKPAGQPVPKTKTVIAVPIPTHEDWRDFAYLAAVPAGAKANDGGPAVIAVDEYGTARPELSDLLRRYGPTQTCLLDCTMTPPAVKEGLVGHWPLDEGSGVVCRDRAGTHSASLLQVPIWTALPGSPHTFDGRTVAVARSDIPGSSPELTVAFWMKPDVAGHQSAVAKHENKEREPGWVVMLRDEKERRAIRFRIGGGDAAWGASDVVADNAYTPGTWVHVACTFSEGTSRIYLDGSLRATREKITWSTPDNITSPLKMGFGSFTGMIDDLRIYDRALDDVEIQQLPGGVGATSAGLTGHWHLDSAANRATPDTVAGHHLVVRGGPSWEEARLKSGIHIKAKSDGLLIGDQSAPLKPFSVRLALTPDGAGQSCILRKPTRADGTPPWSFHQSGKDLVFQIGREPKDRLIAKGALATKVPTVVGATWDDGSAKVFANGSLVASGTVPWRGSPGVDAGPSFDGIVDDIRIHSRAITPDEMKAATPGENLVSRWQLDRKTMAEADGSRWVPGTSASHLRLNGLNDYLDCGSPTPTGASLTVSCWVKPTAPGCLVARLPEDAGAGWALVLTSDRNAVEWVTCDPASGRQQSVARAERAYTEAEWIHIACTVSTERVCVYLDGQRALDKSTKHAGIKGAASPLLIGASRRGADHLKGEFADVRLVDRELSAEEIAAIYAAGSKRPTVRPTVRIRANSPESAACALATKFWTTAETIVCCRNDDYTSALIASMLAGRLRAPLLFTSAGGFSPDTAALITKLRPVRIVTIGARPPAIPSDIESVALAGASGVLSWMRSNGMPVSYLAAANPQDRYLGRVRKASLAAPYLAVARNGAVAPMDFATEWKIPFQASPSTDDKIPGLPANSEKWRTGEIALNDRTLAYTVSQEKGQRNHRLTVRDPAKGIIGPLRTGDRVAIGDREYTVTLDPESGKGRADLWLTWPSTPELRERLQAYYKALGGHPEYLCVLGEPDVIPQALVAHSPQGDEDLSSDMPLADADDDPFVELAHGRLVGENFSSISLTAVRGVLCTELADTGWKSRFGEAGWPSYIDHAFANLGFKSVPAHSGEAGDIDDASSLREVAAIVHGAHSWWLGFGGFYTSDSRVLLAPCIVESSGCSTMRLDRDEQGRSAPARLLRNGSVCVAGNSRNGIAQQYIYRSEFWDALLQGMSAGQAHRHALNRLLCAALERDEKTAGPHRYELHIRTVFGDPAVRLSLPRPKPSIRPARIELKGNEVTFHAPGSWWQAVKQPLAEWNSKLPALHICGGLGVGKEEWWDHRGKHDREALVYTAQLPLREQVVGIRQIGEIPPDLGWSGKYWIDKHQDGTQSIYWRIRPLDVDMATGRIIHRLDTAAFILETR